jgi:hypothetical protein
LPTPLGRAHGERFIHCGLSTAKVGKGLRELEKPSQDRPAGGESMEQIADPVVIGADFGRESCQARGVETGAPGAPALNSRRPHWPCGRFDACGFVKSDGFGRLGCVNALEKHDFATLHV